jgi:hypothetical protein
MSLPDFSTQSNLFSTAALSTSLFPEDDRYRLICPSGLSTPWWAMGQTVEKPVVFIVHSICEVEPWAVLVRRLFVYA